MKKVFILPTCITAVLFAGFLCTANAQYTQPGTTLMAYIAAGGGYNSEMEAASVRFYGGFPSTQFFFSYFVDGGLYLRDSPRAADVNANLRFYIPGSDDFMPYVYTGVNYTRFGGNHAGLNLGAGAQFNAGGGFFFARAQYTVGGLDMVSVNAGFAYIFRTAVR